MAVRMAADAPGAVLYVESDMAGVESYRMAGGEAAVYSARAPDRATANEDSAALLPFRADAGVLVVADGAGGYLAGQRASHLTVTALNESLQLAARTGTGLREAILDGIENAAAAIADLGIGAATTLAVVEIQAGIVRPYHVGDSQIVVMGQRGRIKLQTICHSPVGYAVESGLLDAGEAMHHEDRHLVSNLVGARGMHIEIGPAITLARHDTVLLASDGLFDNLHLDEVIATVRKGPLVQGLEQIARTCRERMRAPGNGEPSKPDDVTCIVFRRDPA